MQNSSSQRCFGCLVTKETMNPWLLFKGVASTDSSITARQCHHCPLASSKGVPEVCISLIVPREHLYLLELENGGRFEALYRRTKKCYKVQVEKNDHANASYS